MRSDLVKLVLQRPNARLAVDEFKVAPFVIVQPGLIDDTRADGFVNAAGYLERHPGIVEPLGPRILIECPEHLSRFADRPADSIEQYGLSIGKVMQNESNRPLSRCVTPRELCVAQIEVLQRSLTASSRATISM